MAKPVLSLAITREPYSTRRMATTISAEKAEQQLLGRALKALRLRLGLTQPVAAEALGTSTQNWQKYEAGERRFTDLQVRRLTAALGAEPQELMDQRARILGEGPRPSAAGMAECAQRTFEIPVWGRPRAGPEGAEVHGAGEAVGAVDLHGLRSPAVGATRIADEAMIPWGHPGETVIFDRDRWPSRGAGCVIETSDGRLYVKVYDHADDAHVFARQFNPEKMISFQLGQVRGVYAIRLRGD